MAQAGSISKQAHLIAVAKGDLPADLILANARIVNVFTGEIESGNIAISGGQIAGVGDYRQAKQTLDLGGKYVAPAFLNGHVHLESSMLDVVQYAQAVVPHGTLGIVTDLHEIANVSGMDGIRYVLDSARRLPLDIFLMAPSCVPATHLETTGACLDQTAIRQLLRRKDCIGLGEVMNFPGVINGDPTVLSKVGFAKGKIADGHAPGLNGKNLSAYIAAGIYSDHESVVLEEAKEKLRQGMHIMIREGSSEKNLETLLPLVTDKTYKRCLLVVDDRTCVDLLKEGDIDEVVRKAIALGLDPVRAIQMATINTAEYFRRDRVGGIAPGYDANIIVIDDLTKLKIYMVFYRGHMVSREGQALFSAKPSTKYSLTNTIKIKPLTKEALRLKANSKKLSPDSYPVIEIVPGQIITRKRIEKVKVMDSFIVPDTSRDVLKLAVVERYKGTGNIGLGLVAGFGLKEGAIASSVAHDSHNIIVAGVSDEDIYLAIKEIEKMQGGLVAVAGGKVLASLPLPIAGLLSSEPLEVVVSKLHELEEVAARLGTKLASPFSTLSFLALPVIPELRLTDLGLVDVGQFKLID